LPEKKELKRRRQAFLSHVETKNWQHSGLKKGRRGENWPIALSISGIHVNQQCWRNLSEDDSLATLNSIVIITIQTISITASLRSTIIIYSLGKPRRRHDTGSLTPPWRFVRH
jgi:hypothetical protein